MDFYVYAADIYCEACGASIRAQLDQAKQDYPETMGRAIPDDPADESSYDSDDYPKGPYPSDQNESDTPQHCGDWGVFLENPLTQAGCQYVASAIMDLFCDDGSNTVVLKEWYEYYGDDIRDWLLDEFEARLREYFGGAA